MPTRFSVLEVRLHGKPIGTLTLFPGEQLAFAFTQNYIDDPARPTLSLSFKDRLGGLITDIRPTRIRVPPFFANLLPEGPLREYLAQRAGVNAQRDFFLLGVLGEDLPGAITVVPNEGPPIQFNDESNLSRSGDADRSAPTMRFSLAGIQLKFSAVMATAGGLTIPVDGQGGSWIVKLPSASFPGVPENEYTMMTMARAVGITVPDVKLVELADIAGLPPEMSRLPGHALAVQRFDRTPGGRVHIEDFAQVFRVYPDDKYAKASYRNIAEVIWAETGEPGIAEYIRRLVFNALIGNADMHLKNWSLIYPNGRTAALAPGYDFVATIVYLDDPTMALKLGRSKHMHELSRESLIHFAAQARLPEKLVLDSARETVERFLSVWEDERAHAQLSKSSVNTIEAHFRKVTLVRMDR